MTSWSGGRHVNLEAVGRGRSGDVVAFWRMGPSFLTAGQLSRSLPNKLPSEMSPPRKEKRARQDRRRAGEGGAPKVGHGLS